MLQWVDFDSSIMKLSAQLRAAALARIGLILRRLVRDIDSVVRHSDKEFLIFVEGPVDRVSLVTLCSKILYECLRSSEKMGQGNIFNMHVAVWQSSSGVSTAEEVMEALKTRLSQMAHGTQRRVQFVDANRSEPQALTEQDIAARRDDVLAKIKAIEATPIVPTVYRGPGNQEAPATDSGTFSMPAAAPNSKPASRLNSRPDSRPASKPTAR
jgi:GGDEF domain-containing protein